MYMLRGINTRVQITIRNRICILYFVIFFKIKQSRIDSKKSRRKTNNGIRYEAQLNLKLVYTALHATSWSKKKKKQADRSRLNAVSRFPSIGHTITVAFAARAVSFIPDAVITLRHSDKVVSDPESLQGQSLASIVACPWCVPRALNGRSYLFHIRPRLVCDDLHPVLCIRGYRACQ
jgi:hypothetical protein